MERGNQSIPIKPPNKAIERKLGAVHGSCLRKPRARPSIPLIAGVRILMQIKRPTSKGHAIAGARLFIMVRLCAKSTPLRNYKWRAENVMLFAPADCGSRPCLGFTIIDRCSELFSGFRSTFAQQQKQIPNV